MRPRILNVADEVENVSVSPTGLRAVVEAHGEILTVPLKHGAMRNITNTPGAMEREPAWSPDGQSVAYFSDEFGTLRLARGVPDRRAAGRADGGAQVQAGGGRGLLLRARLGAELEEDRLHRQPAEHLCPGPHDRQS